MNYGKTGYSLISITARIEISEITLFPDVKIPAPPKGIIIMAYHSALNNQSSLLINELLKQQYGVVAINLLTEQEQVAGVNDVDILSERLVHVTKWVKKVFAEGDINIGLWGLKYCGGAVLKASFELKDVVRSVVCKDPKMDRLELDFSDITIPTLFVVEEQSNYSEFTGLVAGPEKIVVLKSNPMIDKIQKELLEVKESVSWITKFINSEVCLLT